MHWALPSATLVRELMLGGVMVAYFSIAIAVGLVLRDVLRIREEND